MGLAAEKSIFSAADYLAWEAKQSDRHEYLDGEVFAMAGVEDRHVTAAGNCYIALRQHLSGGPCRTYMSDMRLFVAASNSYFYPDVLVTRSAQDCARALIKTEPSSIIEVLSPSTAAYDRGLKFSHYRSLPSSPFHQNIDKMKPMDFSDRLGQRRRHSRSYGNDEQRRVAGKDTISCKGFGETDY